MSFIPSLLLNFSALLLGALGALAAGSGGALAFALEGIMLAGGLAGALSSHLPVLLSLLIAGTAGAVLALLMGYAAIRGANQVFTGVALNGFMAALSLIIAQLIGGVSYSRKTYQLLLGDENVTVFLPAGLLLLLTVWLLLFHTRWGVRLRLCGQSGKTARKMGVRLGGMRVLGTVLCGFLGGIGGLSAMISLGGGWRMEWGVGGMGYLALAALLLGHWKPLGTALFAALLALAFSGAQAALNLGWSMPEEALRLLPFVLALLLLPMAGHRRGMPEDAGEALKRIS